jgi:hypothetical protein
MSPRWLFISSFQLRASTSTPNRIERRAKSAMQGFDQLPTAGSGRISWHS